VSLNENLEADFRTPESFWPTVLSVEPFGTVCRLSVCLSVCDVLYCGETVHPSEKLSEGVNRKPGQNVHFLGRHHISTSGFATTATETAVFAAYPPDTYR